MSDPFRRLGPSKGSGGNAGQNHPAGNVVALGATRPQQRATPGPTSGLFGFNDAAVGSIAVTQQQRKAQMMPSISVLGGLSSSSAIQPKKEKIFAAPRAGSSPLFAPTSSLNLEKKLPGELPDWQKKAVEVDSKNLVSSVKIAITGDRTITEHQMQPMICGAVKSLIQNRHKDLDEVLILSLSRLANVRPEYFRSEPVLSALIALVKRDGLVSGSVPLKGKSTVVNCILGTTVLYSVFQNVNRWPLQLMMLYLEDAANDRQWVDLAECRDFVRAIRFSFGTRAAAVPGSTIQPESSFLDADARKPNQSSRHLLSDDSDRINRHSPSPSVSVAVPSVFGADDSMSDSNLSSAALSSKESKTNRIDRFEQHQAEIPRLVMDVITGALKRSNDGKNLVRLLVTASGIPSVRLLAMQKIDMWMNNAKTANAALALIATVCANCTGTTEEDVNVISLFLKVRCKSKPSIDSYFACLNDLLDRNPDNLHTVLRLSLETELGDMIMARRNPWTLTAMAAAVKMKPNEASSILGNLFAVSLISASDDINRNLRTVLHDLSKVYKADVRYEKFVNHLLSSRIYSNNVLVNQLKSEDQSTRDRKLLSTLDIALSAEILMMIVRYKDEVTVGSLDPFLDILTKLQMLKLDFFRKDGRRHFSPNQETIHAVFRRIFHVEKHILFQFTDKWPTETEKALYLKAASRIKITSTVLWQIMLQMQGCDSSLITDMLEVLIVRALTFRSEDRELFQIHDLETSYFDHLFGMGIYQKPANATLPPKYRPPELIKRDHYWQCWKLIVLLAAADPSKIGSLVWDSYPTAGAFIQMLVINRYDFPPETLLTLDKDVGWFLENEKKMAEDERRIIFDFENRLHGGTSKNLQISETSAVLYKEYTRFDIRGPFRQPPESVFSALEKLNKSMELGKIFSGCRNPDFLLQMVEHRGTAASLPWLLELTSSSKSMFDVLPVECVCEMLSNSLSKKPIGSFDKREQEFQKCRNLAMRLSDSVTVDSAEISNVSKILEFFSNRLCTKTLVERETARTALEIFFDPSKIDRALSSLWGLENRYDSIEADASVRPAILPKSKHGISIEHVLRTSINAWDPFSSLDKPIARVSYATKFQWLLVDIVQYPHFSMLKDNLCLQLAKVNLSGSWNFAFEFRVKSRRISFDEHALELESDTHCVCAYLEFISQNLCGNAASPSYQIQEYLAMQVVADIIVNRKDLRDSVLVSTSDILTLEDQSRIKFALISLFEAFLKTAESTKPDAFGELVIDGKFLEDQILFIGGLSGKSICFTTTVARAYLVLMALLETPEDFRADALSTFWANPKALVPVDCFTEVAVDLFTLEIRELVLKYSAAKHLVDAALSGISMEFLLEMICCKNIPFSTVSQMVKMVDLTDNNSKATLKFIVTRHLSVTRSALDMRGRRGETDDPVHNSIRQLLSNSITSFSTPFSV